MTLLPPRNVVCLCSDANMLVPALFVAGAAAAGLAQRGNPYDVMLVTGPGDTTDAHRRWLAERNIELCDRMDLSPLQGVPIIERRLTSATLFKLLLAGHLAGRYEKILYLDADVILHGDLAPLFDLDLGAAPFAAVPAGRVWAGWTKSEQEGREAHFRALGMSEPFRYFNSGVLLIDVANWNRDNLGERALDFIRRNPQLCRLPDEDALNALLDGKQAELSPLWNMRGNTWAYREIRPFVDPVVIHYDGANKPWKRFARGKRLFEHQDAWLAYKAFVGQSPWPDWLASQWRWRGLLDALLLESRVLSRRLRRKPDPNDPAHRRAYVEAYREYCWSARFIDIEQGIAVRSGGRLALAA